MRSGGQILVDQLKIQGVRHVSCVPGESYLAVLDALYDSGIEVTTCRQEGGAAMIAEAQGKMTGRPGICLVTRGPGACNASAGIHIARQDSTPMVVFVGQVARNMRGRDAFQEVDYRASFSDLAKWVVEVDDPARLPEIVARAFQMAISGRPGPVVVALPEDMLIEMAQVSDAGYVSAPGSAPCPETMTAALRALQEAKRPLVIAGGSRWTRQAVADLQSLSERMNLPVAVSFRRQDLFCSTHPNFAGDLGVAADPDLVAYAKEADVILLLGGRLSEMPSQGYSLLDIPVPKQHLIHVHPGTEELGRVYQADCAINSAPPEFLTLALQHAPKGPDRTALLKQRAEALSKRRIVPAPSGALDMGKVMEYLNETLPDDTVICNGAGNYATWVHRFYRFTRHGTQLAPVSGSMGYGLPAAIAAAREGRQAVAFAGDGCFLMHGQEFATAVQYALPVLVIVVDNGMYGTIRMHQERDYPGRVCGTELKNPDFAAMARAFGGFGETVSHSEEFAPALARAKASGQPALLHLRLSPGSLGVGQTL